MVTVGRVKVRVKRVKVKVSADKVKAVVPTSQSNHETIRPIELGLSEEGQGLG